ncbi:MAG: hypothetical protein WBE03_04855 [Terracidiphilus sp.]
MATRGRKWLIAVVLALAAALIVVVIVTNYMQRKRQAFLDTLVIGGPVDAAVAAGSSTDPGQGTLTVWVPTALVGGDYWVYIDGRIASAPPHSNSAGKNGFIWPSQRHDDDNRAIGWDIEVTDHSGNFRGQLAIRHGYFLNDAAYLSYIKQYLDPASGDSMGLFSAVNLPIQPGPYTVEVIYFSHDHYDASFPFAISPKYHATVEDRSSTELHIGVPDDWASFSMPVAARGNPACDKKPDVSYIVEQMDAYLDDPVVEALSMHKEYSDTDGVVTLDLPAADGGPREFDSAQITDIARAILAHYYKIDEGPSQSYIEDCKNSHPEWSSSLDEYGIVIGRVKDELQFVHRLAGK